MTNMKKNDFAEDLEWIISAVESYYPKLSEHKKKRIRRAFNFAEKSHSHQQRASGEPYFIHPIAATKILCTIRPDIETIEACLLHDVIEDTPVTADEIEKIFGKEVRFLCEGVEKVTKVRLEKNQSQKFENLQKLFIAIAQDIRVVFIKLADRIHNLKTLESLPPAKRERIARESKEIYSHIAGKLGLFEYKSRILDLSFKYLHPHVYETITREVKMLTKERREFVESAKREILLTVQKEGFIEHFSAIHSRQKNLHSIYEKLKRKNLTSAREIFDLFGIRIIVKTKEDCYRMLGILHSAWRPIPGRFKDYISIPKPNGYQALHTTVLGMGKSTLPTEIQIKTEQMHMDAEYGPAAHWAYKKTESSKFDEKYLKRTAWFHQNIPHEKREDPEKFFNEMSTAILEHRVYVFTPRGDVKTLPAGSTPIDFAYNIHTDIGSSCVGARINGVIKQLDYKLKNGEVVEIMTKEGRQPNPQWLKFVKSTHAKNHLKNVINKQKAELEADVPDFTRKASPPSFTRTLSAEKTKTKPRKKSKFEAIIGGEKSIPHKFADCCHPKAGDNIIAYKSRGLDFTIHKQDCDEVEKLDPVRFLEAHFAIEFAFNIKAHNKIGILMDYTRVIMENGVNILGSKSMYDKKTETSKATFKVECQSRKEFTSLLNDIGRLRNVISIEEI